METTLKPKKKQTGIRLTPELIRELKYLSADTEKSLSALVEEAVQDLLKKYQSRQ
jgi:predicted DNA-binding protein